MSRTPDWREELHQQRVDAIKTLRQGEGMTVEKIRNMDIWQRSLRDQEKGFDPFPGIWGYSTKSPEGDFNLARWAALSLLDDQYSLAIRNALAIGQGVGKGNLTERRMHLLEQMDVSLRTLINYEDTGADMLARQIALTYKIRDDIDAVDTVELIAQVDQLKTRVENMEKKIEALLLQQQGQSATPPMNFGGLLDP